LPTAFPFSKRKEKKKDLAPRIVNILTAVYLGPSLVIAHRLGRYTSWVLGPNFGPGHVRPCLVVEDIFLKSQLTDPITQLHALMFHILLSFI
jgi:hypothetical protein